MRTPRNAKGVVEDSVFRAVDCVRRADGWVSARDIMLGAKVNESVACHVMRTLIVADVVEFKTSISGTGHLCRVIRWVPTDDRHRKE